MLYLAQPCKDSFPMNVIIIIPIILKQEEKMFFVLVLKFWIGKIRTFTNWVQMPGTCQLVNNPYYIKVINIKILIENDKDRTYNPSLKRRILYQLSYIPIIGHNGPLILLKELK